jgi:hypothetical protein
VVWLASKMKLVKWKSKKEGEGARGGLLGYVAGDKGGEVGNGGLCTVFANGKQM